MESRKKERGKSPLPSDEQDYPAPERPETPAEEAGQSIEDLDDPPKAEGDRDSVDQ